MADRSELMDRRDLMAGAGGFCLWTALAAMPGVSEASVRRSPVVETSSGKVRGSEIGGIYDFRGVPYGAPTGGAARFLPPQKRAPWRGVRDAVASGPRCYQLPIENLKLAPGARNPPADIMSNGGMPRADSPMSEDCLVLDVSTPGLGDARRLPVMVFFHGGGFSTGAGSLPVYSGINLARNGNGVVVTVTHRLSIFGHLFLDDLGGSRYAGSGNASLLDLVLALEWIQDNIARFGGDPNNVTAFGQSGGAYKVSCILAMPAARGLVSKAILQSGAARAIATREEQAAKTVGMLTELGLGLGDLRSLHEVPAERLVALRGATAKGGLTPVMDGVTLPHDPFAADGPGMSATVPLLINTMLEESAFQPNVGGDPLFGRLSLDDLRTHMRPTLGARTDEGIALYRNLYPAETPSYLWVYMTTDLRFYAKCAVPIAERTIRRGAAPVYMSVMEWRAPGFGGIYRAAHCVDLPFVFDNVDTMPQLTGRTAAAHRLAKTMSKAWMAFARTGNPDHPDMTHWPRYTVEERQAMSFGPTVNVHRDPKREAREFWASVDVHFTTAG